MAQQIRYAIYAMPAENHPLAATAARWLGRDPYRNAAVAFDAVTGLGTTERESLVAAAARYGFHGTLLAPFAPAEGLGANDLAAAVDGMASELPPVTIPELALLRLGDFFALGPSGPAEDLQRLADRIVVDGQLLRAPLSEAELARRRKAGLTPAEDANLVTWGYPYVFRSFRYHMTLTGPVAGTDAPRIETILRRYFDDFIDKPFVIDTLALCVEPAPGAPFRVEFTAALTGSNMAGQA